MVTLVYIISENKDYKKKKEKNLLAFNKGLKKQYAF